MIADLFRRRPSVRYCSECGKVMDDRVVQRGFDRETGAPCLYRERRCPDRDHIDLYDHDERVR